MQDFSGRKKSHAGQTLHFQFVADETAPVVELGEGDEAEFVSVDGSGGRLLPVAQVFVQFQEGLGGDGHAGFPVYS